MSRAAVISVAIGLVAAVGWVVAAFVEPERAAIGWLLAWSWAVNTALGCALLVMIAHVAPIRWFTALRRPMADVAATLPLLAALFVPIALLLPHLYPWAGPIPADLPHSERLMLARKAPWLNEVGWLLRSVAYLAIGSLFALRLRALDRDGGDDALRRAFAWSAGGLVVFGILWTLAAVDWWMSLDPLWTSTIVGFWRFAGGMVGALCVALLVARLLERHDRVPRLPADVYHALGRLLLSFVVLWTYTTYDQLMLQWIAGLPHEARYWIPRLAGEWYAWVWVLGLAHFAVPFALLLSRAFKRRRDALAALAVWLLAARYLDEVYLVVPFFDPAGPAPSVSWLLAFLAVGGLVTGAATALAAGRVPAPYTRWTLEYDSP